MRYQNTILAPFLAGGLIGAGATLLATPKSGKAFRKDLRKLAAHTGDQVSAAIDEGRELVGEGRAKIAGAIKESKAAIVEQTEKLERLIRPAKRNSSFVAPLIAGGIGGAVLALLFAPKPGKELRQDMKKFAADVGDGVTSAYHKGRALFEEGTEKVAGVVEAGKERIRELRAV